VRCEGHVTCIGERRVVLQGFGEETSGKETTWKNRGVDGRYRDGSAGSGVGGMEWNDLAQNRDR
jgi:hypothetical protein